MTLFKQVLFVFTILIIMILSIVMVLNITNDKKFLQGQLESNTQNVATALSLSLSESMRINDMLLGESIISSIYDSGYYEYIRLVDVNGKILLEKRKNIVIKDVPDWVIHIIPFELQPAKVNVTVGWQNYGTVEIKGHTGYAYFKLWETFIELFESILFIGIFGVVIIFIGLKILLSSLAKIEKQALAITKNSFIRNNDKPFTIEFKRVIEAMNLMVGKVENIFNNEVEHLNKYNNLLYKDTILTNVSNRRFFILKLNEYLNESSQYNSGVFMFLTVTNLNIIKELQGFANFKAILCEVSEVLLKIEKVNHNAVVAKLNEHDFAMLIPQIKIKSLKEDIEKEFSEEIKQLNRISKEASITLSLHISMIEYSSAETQKTLLSKADNLFSKAKQFHTHKIEFEENVENLISLGKEEWSLIVKELKLAGEYFKLAFQSSLDCSNNQVFSKEIYLRFLFKNTLYSANQILPIINELKLQDEINKFVIHSTFEYLAKTNKPDILALNIDTSFIGSIDNLQWLKTIIKENTKVKEQIIFEAPAQEIMDNIEIFTNFMEMMKKMDIKFGIDNFAFRSNYDYLHLLKPSYLKIDKTVLLDLVGEKENGMLKSLNTIAKTLDIDIIATAVENEEEKQTLLENQIKYMQGRYIDEISILE